MNRRDFCLSLGTVVAGSACGIMASGRGTHFLDTPKPGRSSIHAKKIFPKQWLDELADHSPVRQRAWLRDTLRRLAEQHDALVLASTASGESRFVESIAGEARRIGLDVYCSARAAATLCDGATGAVVGVCPLFATGDVIVLRVPATEVCEEYHGCLISYESDHQGKTREHRRLVLTDSSRGRWQIFERLDGLDHSIGVRNRTTERELNLATARLLDRFVRGGIKTTTAFSL